MPWVQQNDLIVNPGDNISCGQQTVANQFFGVRFPNIPQAERRYFGLIWLRSDQNFPDLTVVVENLSKPVWFNGTIWNPGPLTVNGFVYFRVQERFGGPVRVKTYRFV